MWNHRQSELPGEAHIHADSVRHQAISLWYRKDTTDFFLQICRLINKPNQAETFYMKPHKNYYCAEQVDV